MSTLKFSKPIITAHSGCEGTGIDTMESIDKALFYGADAIEIDVRLDPFGDMRISHDPLSIEDYLQKNLLANVFQRVRTTSLLINFDLKEEAALYKTLDAARNDGFPMERLIFTGCTTPVRLVNDPELTRKANFFINLEELLKYVFEHHKEEFSREVFQMLMEEPFLILIDEDSEIPDMYFSKPVSISQKIYAISRTVREKIYEDAVRSYQETKAAAVNLPKFLLYTRIAEIMKASEIPLSVWTVNEPEMVRRCLEAGACNITTQKIQMTKQILEQNELIPGSTPEIPAE